MGSGLKLGPMSARRPFRSGAASAVAACLLLAPACTGSHEATRGPSGPSGPTSWDNAPAESTLVLQVMPAPYQLPAALSREVALPGADGLLIAGGLTPSGASSDTVNRLDPVTGATSVVARLAAPTHDAAGATLGGPGYLFGGGTATRCAQTPPNPPPNTRPHLVPLPPP